MEKINRMPPHLIFMDICLPGSNGLQLTRKIKKYFPNLKLAMLTAYDFPEYQQAAKKMDGTLFYKRFVRLERG